jgi:hypothetical protein
MMFRFIKTWFKNATMTERERIDAYLAQSVSLADLERRQRELQSRGFNA